MIEIRRERGGEDRKEGIKKLMKERRRDGKKREVKKEGKMKEGRKVGRNGG